MQRERDEAKGEGDTSHERIRAKQGTTEGSRGHWRRQDEAKRGGEEEPANKERPIDVGGTGLDLSQVTSLKESVFTDIGDCTVYIDRPPSLTTLSLNNLRGINPSFLSEGVTHLEVRYLDLDRDEFVLPRSLVQLKVLRLHASRSSMSRIPPTVRLITTRCVTMRD
jgi:hypothetical protein